MKKSLPLLCFLLSGTMAGCAVGPNYAGPPKVADVPGFHRADASTTTAAPPPAQWWRQLNDAELNTLEDAALSNSPTLAAAEARLRQSRAQLATSRANGLPNTGLTAAYVHADGLGKALGGLSGGAAASGRRHRPARPQPHPTAPSSSTMSVSTPPGRSTCSAPIAAPQRPLAPAPKRPMPRSPTPRCR